MRGAYDHVRCPVCAINWHEHTSDCSRHDYGPSIRISVDGVDVSGNPEYWSGTDTFRYSDGSVVEPTKKRRRKK